MSESKSSRAQHVAFVDRNHLRSFWTGTGDVELIVRASFPFRTSISTTPSGLQ